MQLPKVQDSTLHRNIPGFFEDTNFSSEKKRQHATGGFGGISHS